MTGVALFASRLLENSRRTLGLTVDECPNMLNIDKYPFCLKDLKDNDPQR